ncbi:MAG: cytochrome c3 family protein [Chloroflexota bacterium]
MEAQTLRRLGLVVAGGALWLLLAAAPALADNGPHHMGASPITDGCAACHRAHSGQNPGLIISSQTSLCYTCHGTTGTGATTDVQDGVQYAPVTTSQVGTTTRTGTTFTGALRGGGFDQAILDSSLSGSGSTGANAGKIGTLPQFALTTSKHNVDEAGTAWGAGNISGSSNPGVGVALTCASCHDPHGNGQYRILKTTPDDAYTGAYTGITPNRGSMSNVAIADVSTYVYTTTDYWHPEDANSTGSGSYIANISNWCSSCHTRYLAGGNSADTNSGDAIFRYRHTTTGTTFAGNDATAPTCVQCHVAHGSNAAVGTNSAAVALPGQSGGRGPDSSLLRIDNRGVCQKCHNK